MNQTEDDSDLQSMKKQPDKWIFTPPILHVYHRRFGEMPMIDGKPLATKCPVCREEFGEEI